MIPTFNYSACSFSPFQTVGASEQGFEFSIDSPCAPFSSPFPVESSPKPTQHVKMPPILPIPTDWVADFVPTFDSSIPSSRSHFFTWLIPDLYPLLVPFEMRSLLACSMVKLSMPSIVLWTLQQVKI